MNVSELRQRIFDQMDYFPDLQQYRDSVVRRLNDRYQELNDSAHWIFLQKEREITLRPAIEGSATITIQVNTSNSRLVNATGFTAELEMEGQTLTNTDSGQTFTIVRVLSGSQFYINGSWDGAKSTAVSEFKITYQRFLLPEDCIEVLGYLDRDADRGKLLFIGRRREEYAYLDADNTGDPSTVVEDEHIIDDPPINTPTITISTTTNTSNLLVNGNKYEYMYTIYREGRESPPSLPVQITIPSTGNNSVLLSNLDDTGHFETAASATTVTSGMQKLIYRRDVTKDGKWILVGQTISTSTQFKDEELQPKTAFSYQNQTAFRYASSTEVLRWQDPGPRQYVRFWYTPDSTKNIHLRYHFRPKDLVADNDAPYIPRQYHIILVYLVLQDMFMQMQDTVQAQLFERRAEQVRIQMRRRYLARDDERKRFQRWDRPRRFKNVYGTPTIAP